MGGNIIITEHIFWCYLNCKHKSFLKLHGQIGKESTYERLQNRLLSKFRIQAQSKLCSGFHAYDILSTENLTESDLSFGKPLIINTSIKVDNLYCTFDALKKISLDSNSGSFQYVPVLYLRDQQISTKEKVLLSFKAYVLAGLQTMPTTYGHIIYGRELKDKKIYLDSHIEKVRTIIDELIVQVTSDSDKNCFLGTHCDICEFSEHCIKKVTDRNCLSLLRNMSHNEIKRHNEKGIFTVTNFHIHSALERHQNVPNIHPLRDISLFRHWLYVKIKYIFMVYLLSLRLISPFFLISREYRRDSRTI